MVICQNTDVGINWDICTGNKSSTSMHASKLRSVYDTYMIRVDACIYVVRLSMLDHPIQQLAVAHVRTGAHVALTHCAHHPKLLCFCLIDRNITWRYSLQIWYDQLNRIGDITTCVFVRTDDQMNEAVAHWAIGTVARFFDYIYINSLEFQTVAYVLSPIDSLLFN